MADDVMNAVEPLPTLVMAMTSRPAHGQVFDEPRWVRQQRALYYDCRVPPLFPVGRAESAYDRVAVHDLQSEPATSHEHASHFAQHVQVLLIGFEESKRIEQRGGGNGIVANREGPHVSAYPAYREVERRGELSRTREQMCGEVESRDVRSALREGERMASVAAPDVEHTRACGESQSFPQSARFSLRVLGRRSEGQRCE